MHSFNNGEFCVDKSRNHSKTQPFIIYRRAVTAKTLTRKATRAPDQFHDPSKRYLITDWKWFKPNSGQTLVFQWEHSGSMLKRLQPLVRIRQWNVKSAWIQLLKYYPLNPMIALATLKSLVLQRILQRRTLQRRTLQRRTLQRRTLQRRTLQRRRRQYWC